MSVASPLSKLGHHLHQPGRARSHHAREGSTRQAEDVVPVVVRIVFVDVWLQTYVRRSWTVRCFSSSLSSSLHDGKADQSRGRNLIGRQSKAPHPYLVKRPPSQSSIVRRNRRLCLSTQGRRRLKGRLCPAVARSPDAALVHSSTGRRRRRTVRECAN